MKIRFFISLIFMFLLIPAFGNSMRKCLILPIEDSIGGGLGYKVFEEVENYLKDSDWCSYTSNSDILNILSSYQRNLNAVLENGRVLKVIAEKTGAGSLIKIKIKNEVKGTSIAIKVIGENGEDIYFKEKTRLNTDEYKIISQAVKNWLVIYEKQIPYDGKITGVIGNQFTVEGGRNRGLFKENNLLIIRPMGKKSHPLLKEIVDWNSEKLGEGRVVFSSDDQSQGKMTLYSSKKRIKKGDWVLLKREKAKSFIEQEDFKNKKDYEFGKLGEFSLLLNMGKGSASAELPETKKIGGLVLGIDFRTILWITRKYWIGLDFTKVTGELSSEEGVLSKDENDINNTFVNIKAGYKYLPLGFFYGPQIDFYFGYGSYIHELETSIADGFSEFSFRGLLLGARGSIPFKNLLRLKLELSLLFSPEFKESTSFYGSEDSARSYTLEIGSQYLYAPNMTFDISYMINSSKGSFKNPIRSINVKQSALKFGTTFTF